MTTARVDLRDNDVALGVSGNHAENLKAIERRLGVRVGQRGTELHLSGPADAVASAVRLVEQLETIHRAGQPKKEDADLKRLLDMLRAVNYRGYVALEYEADEDPKTGVPKAVAALKKLV